MALYILDNDIALNINEAQRNMLLERGIIYYCEDHSKPDNSVYHVQEGHSWVDVRMMLEEQREEESNEQGDD